MNLLLDTNIFLEVLLGQEKAEDSAALLCANQRFSLFMTDFSLHSIGVLLFRRRNFDVFSEFVGDLDTAGIQVLSLPRAEISSLSAVASSNSLDFDDAYQYETARRYGLTLVSFDGDFDRTEIKRMTPRDVLDRPL